MPRLTTFAMAAALLPVLWPFSAAAELRFSRRVYQEHGATYQQIWSWSPATHALTQLTFTPRDHDPPVCEGRRRAAPRVSYVAAGFEKTPGCAQYARAGELEACGNDELLVVSRGGKQIGRFPIETDRCPIDNKGTVGKCETPIRSLGWSPDGEWLLIGEQGLDDNSTQRQNDYYLLRRDTLKIARMASAETALWLPSNKIVYVTPRDLAPLQASGAKHRVWVQALMLFDPAANTSAPIAAGLSSNINPVWCDQGR